MHELSIALSLLDVAEEEAERRGGAEVLAIHLRLGGLAGVVREALESAFELARECSCSPRSALVIEETPVLVFCPECETERQVASIQEMRCRECGAFSARVVQGRELEITALELAS